MATWPTTLPSPEKSGYQLAPTAQTIRTEMETGLPRVRRRSAARNDKVSVQWKFTDAQMVIFRAWFDSPLHAAAGASWFSLEIPDGAGGFHTREARFDGEWSADVLPGMNWRVTAKLETRGGELTADQVRGAIEGLVVNGVYPVMVLAFATDKALDSRITFTRATTATYFDAAGVMQTAAAGEARFDHDPATLESLGLLIEEGRTNLVLNSATLVTQNVTVTATPYTLSFYGTGTVTLSGASTAGPLVGTGASNRVSLTFTPTAGTLTLTVSGTVSLAQLEAGAFKTSYIPTTTVAVTRNADVASMTGTNFSAWYNAGAGTLFVGGDVAGFAAPNYPRFAGLYLSGSESDSFGVGQWAAATVTAYAVASSVPIASLASAPSGLAFGSHVDAAAAYAANDFAFSANGTAASTDTSGVLSASLNGLWIGSNGSTAPLNGHIKLLAYYNQRLTNAQLQAITA